MKYGILVVCLLGLVGVIGYSLAELGHRKQKSRRFHRLA